MPKKMEVQCVGYVRQAEDFCWLGIGLEAKYPEVEGNGTTEPTTDNRTEVFQTLTGDTGNVELSFAGSQPFVQNLVCNTLPKEIHGNGPSKLFLITLGNYLAHSWHSEDGCLECWEESQEFPDLAQAPKVVLAIFIEKPTPFMDEFWEKLGNLEYDKSRIDSFVHNAVVFHKTAVSNFVNDNTDLFNTVEAIGHEEDMSEGEARELAMEKCIVTKCGSLFVVDSDVRLDNNYVLKLLIEQNREVIAPMLIRPYTAWSNFWGSLSSDGFHAGSFVYMEIVNNDKELIPDMAIAASIRDKDRFLFVSDRLNFGHLMNNEGFRTGKKNNGLCELERNPDDWELRSIHPNHPVQEEAE